MDILRQTTFMVVFPIMVDNFASLLNCTTITKTSLFKYVENFTSKN